MKFRREMSWWYFLIPVNAHYPDLETGKILFLSEYLVDEERRKLRENKLFIDNRFIVV
jgi:hypothetical protein